MVSNYLSDILSRNIIISNTIPMMAFPPQLALFLPYLFPLIMSLSFLDDLSLLGI